PLHPGLHRRAGAACRSPGRRELQHRARNRYRDGARPLERGTTGESVTQTVEEEAEARTGPPHPRHCLCESYARPTERAALASARWLGRGDQQAAEEAAFSGMRHALENLPISGRIVIGSPEGTGDLAIGQEIGSGGDPVDLAL